MEGGSELCGYLGRSILGRGYSECYSLVVGPFLACLKKDGGYMWLE